MRKIQQNNHFHAEQGFVVTHPDARLLTDDCPASDIHMHAILSLWIAYLTSMDNMIFGRRSFFQSKAQIQGAWASIIDRVLRIGQQFRSYLKIQFLRVVCVIFKEICDPDWRLPICVCFWDLSICLRLSPT